MKFLIDFEPGAHGHFLELVLNKYVFGVKYDGDDIFQSSGAAHKIRLNQDYQKNKFVGSGHFFWSNWSYPKLTEKVVVIKHDPNFHFVLITNIYNRCHAGSLQVEDFDTEKIKEFHHRFLTDNDFDNRNNWFTRLTRVEDHQPKHKPRVGYPAFYFNYSSFFNFVNFCNELNKTANFFERSIIFDVSLYHLWEKFINLNQGWQKFNLGNKILEFTLQGKKIFIPNDWQLHAYLNYKLSEIFGICEGPLFDSDHPYPENSTLLLNEILTYTNEKDLL